MGFSWNRKYFLEGFCFEESVADVRVGQTFIQGDLQIVLKAILSKNSPTHEAVEGLFGFYFFSLEFRGWNKRKKAWPTPKFCG